MGSKKKQQKVEAEAAALQLNSDVIADLKAANMVLQGRLIELRAENVELKKLSRRLAVIALPLARLGAGSLANWAPGVDVHTMTILPCDVAKKLCQTRDWVRHDLLPVVLFHEAAKMLAELEKLAT